RPSPRAIRTGREVNNVVLGLYNARERRHRWLLVHARPQFRDGESTPYQSYSTYTDITALRETQEALVASEERLHRILETVTDGIIIFDMAGRLSFANRAAEELLGLDRPGV